MAATLSQQFVEDLLETKLHPPRVRHEVLSRRDLFDGLASRDSDGVLFVVTAPAGSGKTTALVELHDALKAEDFVPCWLSLDEYDDDPAVFAKYIVAALHPLDPAAAEKELGFIKANPSRNYEAFFDAVVARLARIRCRFALLIDDFQFLHTPLILEFWNRLIAHAPPAARIALASRARPPLDLGRKRVAGTLVERNREELNFTAAQADTFMRSLHAIAMDEASSRSLFQTTEGWAAGLQLAALAIHRARGSAAEMVASFSGRNKDLTDYLLQTVLRFQPEDVRRFLLRTSPLSRLSPGLCNAVCVDDDGAALLDLVERANLFLVPLDQEGRWFRYHHLFADFLRAELRRSNPEEYTEVCGLAAQWSESQGRLTEAVQYHLAGESYARAADLIAERAPALAQDQGDHETILTWMQRLPADYHDRRPEILLNHAWSRAFSRDLDRAIDLAQLVLDGLDPAGGECRWALSPAEREHLHALAQIIQIIAHVCADRLDETIDECEALRERLPAEEPFLLASVLNATSYCHLARRERAAAVERAAEAYAYGRKAGSAYATVWADFLSTMGQVELGNIREACRAAERAVRQAGPPDRSTRYIFALAGVSMAECYLQQGRFEAARQSLVAVQEFSAAFGPREPLWAVLRNEARLNAWEGRLEAACEVMAQAREVALSTDQPLLHYAAACEEIALRLRHGGDVRAAEALYRSSGLDSAHTQALAGSIKAAVVDMSRLSKARLDIATDDAEAALRGLSLIIRASAESGQQALLQHARALRSVALWRAGRRADAARELDRALGPAADEQHAYPILQAGAEVHDILSALQQKRTAGCVDADRSARHAFEGALLGLLSGAAAEVAVPTQTVHDGRELLDPLTDREIEILKLVAAGLGNQQLADELLISLATVKWHLHNVYEKLGVRSRTAAVALARQLRLI